MGAWGVRALENDDAADWSDELQETSDLSLVEETLEMIETVSSDYLEADVACEVLAACELIARMLGRSGYSDAYSEPLDEWVAKHSIDVPSTLVARASHAIDLVISEDSELKELWQESDEYAAWLAAVEDLRHRVTGDAAGGC